MSVSSNKVVVDVELRAQLNQMKSGAKELENIFKNLNLSPGKNTQMMGTLNSYKQNIKDIEELLSQPLGEKGLKSLTNKLQENEKLFGIMRKEIQTLGNYSDSQLEKLFPPEFTAAIKSATVAINSYKTKIRELEKQDTVFKDTQTDIRNTEVEIKNLTKDLEAYKELYNNIMTSNFSEANTKGMTGEVKTAVQDWKESQNQIDKTSEKVNKLANEYSVAKEAYEQYIKATKGPNATARYSSTTKDFTFNGQKFASAANANQTNAKLGMADYDQAIIKLEQLRQKHLQFEVEAQRVVQVEIYVKEDELDAAKQDLIDLQSDLASLDQKHKGQAFQQIIQDLQQIKGLNIDFTKITNLGDFSAQLNNLTKGQLDQLKNAINNGKVSIQNMGNATQDAKGKVEQATNSLASMAQQMNSISSLAQRGMYFFGLINQMQLLKSATRKAYDAVKELDQAMTQTAVVTNFSVGDMWEQLPEYSKVAREYNATLNDAYEVMTLYYQQGLETSQVFAVGTETMKMARIAGLEYEEATDRRHKSYAA